LVREEYWLQGGNNPVQTYGYDSYGNLVLETDANGYETRYEYDQTGRFVIMAINAKSQQSSYEYDIVTGSLTAEIDPNGYKTEYAYDAFGRRIKEIRPYDSAESPTAEFAYEFDGSAPERTIVRQKENEAGTLDSFYYYDGFGNLMQAKREAENSQFIANDIYYDNVGRLSHESNPYYAGSSVYSEPNGAIAKRTYSYDTLDRQTKIRNTDGTEVNIAYDHWTTNADDENSNRKDSAKDAYGNIITIKEYNNDETYATGYSYDAASNLIEIADNQGNKIRYSYDTLGRKTRLEDPDLGIWQYEYDANGNLIRQADSKGNSIALEYDGLGRIKRKIAGSSIITYTYDDPIGVLTSIQTPDIAKGYRYDQRLRVVEEESVIDGISFKTAYAYDAMDRVLSKTLPNGQSVAYSYNNQGSLESMDGIIRNIDYNEAGSPVRKEFQNSLATQFTYDNINYKLRQIKTGDKQELNYKFDNKDNIIEINDAVSTKTERFGYDDLDRLTRAVKENPAGQLDYDMEYGYDSIGNIISLLSNFYNLVFTYRAHAPVSLGYAGNEPPARLCQLQEGVCRGAWQYFENGQWTQCDYGSQYQQEESGCDLTDNDCDGSVDEGVQGTFYQDSDADTFGALSTSKQACSAPEGFVANSNDCNDDNPAVHEIICGICGGSKSTYYRDADGDTYGDPADTILDCSAPSGYISDNNDCGDTGETAAGINPGASESCNGADDNCNSQTDESLTAPNADKQSGICANSKKVCGGVSRWLEPDYAQISGYQDSEISCDGIDNDCDGNVDESAPVFYQDADSDGYGNAALTAKSCAAPSGYVIYSTDCDETNPAINPGGIELCDNADNNCDGRNNEGFGDYDSDSIADCVDDDLDGDGISNEQDGIEGTVEAVETNVRELKLRVDNSDPAANEPATPMPDESQQSPEQNEGQEQEAESEVVFVEENKPIIEFKVNLAESNLQLNNIAITKQEDDADKGFLVVSGIELPEEKTKSVYIDNIDSNSRGVCVKDAEVLSVNEVSQECGGESETFVSCNGIDVNGYKCEYAGGRYKISGLRHSAVIQSDAEIDNDNDGYFSNIDCNDDDAGRHEIICSICGGSMSTYYRDDDADGYGDPAITASDCSPPLGFVSNSADCRDTGETAAGINPGASESCNGIDDNCNSQTDESLTAPNADKQSGICANSKKVCGG
ncbi:hypothetical protein HYT54_03750, partial [Candidatus Woesearchaeota archaeon]|nr:hypothetical protein [Candidatus Woesearchaeota archaeon]